MKSIRSLTFAAVLATAGTMILAAQEPAPANPPAAAMGGQRQVDPNQQVKRLAKKLNLSADQQSQLLPILTARRDEMQNIRNDGLLSREDRRSKMGALRSDTDAKIKAVLNDDQKKSYDQMQQEQREKVEQRRSNGGGDHNQ